VKGFTTFVEKYVTGRRKRFRSHRVYVPFLGIIWIFETVVLFWGYRSWFHNS